VWTPQGRGSYAFGRTLARPASCSALDPSERKVDSTGLSKGARPLAELESFGFGDSPELMDELLELVLTGKKTATCWAASEGDKGAAIGRRWIAKDGQGRRRVILETVELTRRQFGEVDAAFAYDEGEDNRTLADWRAAHTAYFTGRGEFSPDMELYCERFRLVEVLEQA
jgi:uncharacterized protein YhfF